MKYFPYILTFVLILSWTKASMAAGTSENGSIPWIPYALRGIVANAALDDENFPVVLFNTEQQRALFPSVSRFMMIREEIVATVAARQADGGQLTRTQIRKAGGSRAQVGRYLLVEESLIYEELQAEFRDLKGLDATGVLSCAAYLRFTSEQRATFLKEYRMADGFGDRIVFGDSLRAVTYRQLKGELQICDEYSKRQGKK